MSKAWSQQTKDNPKDSSDHDVYRSPASSLPEFTAFLNQLDVHSYDQRKSLRRIKDSRVFESTLKSLSDDDWEDCLEFMQCCLRKNHEDVLKFATFILKYKKFLDWKGHPELLENLLATLIDITRDRHSPDDIYSDFVEMLMKIIRQNDLFKDHATVLIALMQPTISDEAYKLHWSAGKIAEGFAWQNHRELTRGILHNICNQLEELLKGTMPSKTCNILGPRLKDIVQHIIKAMTSSSAEKVLPWVTKIYNLCLKANKYSSINRDRRAICQKILCIIMREYYCKHQKNSPQLCQPILKSLFELAESEDEDLQGNAVRILEEVAATPEVAQEEGAEEFIRLFLSETSYWNNHFPWDLTPLFRKYPDTFCQRADDFVNRLVQDIDSGNDRALRTMQPVWEMAKTNPQAFSSDSIKELVKILPNKDVQVMTMFTLQALSAKQQEDLLPYRDDIVCAMNVDDTMGCAGATLLGNLAITESHAREILKILLQRIQSTFGHMKPSLIGSLRPIGLQYPNVLGEFRDVLEEIGKETSSADYIRQVLDLIEGRSLADVSRMIDQQKGVMNDLENRVACVEHDLDNLTNQAEGASGEISDKERPPRPPRPAPTSSPCTGCSALQEKLLSCQTAQQKLQQDLEVRDKEVHQLKSRQNTMENQWARLWQKMNSELTKVKQQLQKQGEKIEESRKAEAESQKAEAESQKAEAESQKAGGQMESHRRLR